MEDIEITIRIDAETAEALDNIAEIVGTNREDVAAFTLRQALFDCDEAAEDAALAAIVKIREADHAEIVTVKAEDL